MKSDLERVIINTAGFLNAPINESELKTLKEHLTFESMRNNPAVNYEKLIGSIKSRNPSISKDAKFMRSGKVRDFINYISNETAEKFDRWTKEKTEGTGLKFFEGEFTSQL